jgi:hypothetical protein
MPGWWRFWQGGGRKKAWRDFVVSVVHLLDDDEALL